MSDAAQAVQAPVANGNNLELNAGDDFIFALDVSGSMSTRDTPNGQTRYDFAKEKALAFANEAQKIDTDGISVVLSVAAASGHLEWARQFLPHSLYH